MVLHRSEETHQNLIARIPQTTGRGLSEWFREVEDGPALLRFDERVDWLRTEHNLSHGYAAAIIREYDRRRAARNLG